MVRNRRSAGLILLVLGLAGSGIYGVSNYATSKSETKALSSDSQLIPSSNSQDNLGGENGGKEAIDANNSDIVSVSEDSNDYFKDSNHQSSLITQTIKPEKKTWKPGSLGVKVWFDKFLIDDWKVAGDWITKDFFDFRDNSYQFNKENETKITVLAKDVSDDDLPNLSISSNWKNDRKVWSSNYVLGEGLQCTELTKRLGEYFKFRTRADESEKDNGLNKLWIDGERIIYRAGYRSFFPTKDPLALDLWAGGVSCSIL